MRWIEPIDLKQWADTYFCKFQLQFYIKELIFSTAKLDSIEFINFPSGNDVNTKGLDGELKSKYNTKYIPKGHSIWEIGEGKGIKAKADKDYKKRTNNPNGYVPKNCYFIFVTARGYTKKTDWENEKNNLKQWINVKFYDASILADWFNESGVVSYQLAIDMDKYLQGIKALKDYWMRWCRTRDTELKPEILLANRDNEKKYVEKWLYGEIADNGKKDRLIIFANSKEEAIAFVAAVIETITDDKKDFYYSKAIIVNDCNSFDSIINKKSQHIIINNSNYYDSINYAVSKGHKVIVPIINDNQNSLEADLILKNMPEDIFLREMSNLNFELEKCIKLFEETGGDLKKLKEKLT